jgi:hypothetical protein
LDGEFVAGTIRSTTLGLAEMSTLFEPYRFPAGNGLFSPYFHPSEERPSGSSSSDVYGPSPNCNLFTPYFAEISRPPSLTGTDGANHQTTLPPAKPKQFDWSPKSPLWDVLGNVGAGLLTQPNWRLGLGHGLDRANRSLAEREHRELQRESLRGGNENRQREAEKRRFLDAVFWDQSLPGLVRFTARASLERLAALYAKLDQDTQAKILRHAETGGPR